MKLQELANKQSSKQISNVFESYFGNAISFDNLTVRQSRQMLNRVRNLVTEHKKSSDFHVSQQNPAYLKLMMMEQILSKKLSENATGMSGATGMQSAGSAPSLATDPAKAKAAQAATLSKIKDPKLQGAMKKSMNGQNLSSAEQQLVANAAMAGGAGQLTELSKKTLKNYVKKAGASEFELGRKFGNIERAGSAYMDKADKLYNKGDNRYTGISRAADRLARESRNPNSLRRRLSESEIQQAQVVLAAQDMVDQVQKMIEQMTSVQFKDLPALVQQIQNEIGQQQATQFNSDATAAMTNLVNSLQQSKVQLESAVGVVTGQGAIIPGQDEGTPMGNIPSPPSGELGAEVPDLGGDEDIDIDIDSEEEIAPPPTSSLGRKRR